MSAGLIFVSLLVTLMVTAYLYVKNAFLYWKRKGVPFKKPSFPFGNFTATFLQRKSNGEDLEDLYNATTEPFLGIYSTLQPVLLVRDPKLVKDIFIKDFNSFGHRGWHANVDVDPMSDNIFLQKGERWRNVRAQFTPAFSSTKLKSMFDVIIKCGQSMERFVGDFADNGKTVEIRDVFARFATNMIVSTAFGLEIDCIVNRDEEFRVLGPRFFNANLTNMLRNNLAVMTPKLAKFLGLRFVDKEVSDFMIDTVRQNLEYREKHNIVRKDFFQLLMQLRNTGKIQENDDWTTNSTSSEKTITLEEMAAQAHLFFLGGFETSSTTMSFLMYEWAKHPEIQQKAYEEIVEVIAKHGGKMTYDALADMKYVGQCLDETLRMYPPLATAMRRCTKNYTIPDTNVVIEEGTLLMFSASGLSNDPKYYDEPRKFKPERYSESQIAGKTFEEMPNLAFGEGPRTCIGMILGKFQSKIAVVLLLRKFRFELADEHKNTKLKLNPLAMAQTPMNGVNLKVFSR